MTGPLVDKTDMHQKLKLPNDFSVTWQKVRILGRMAQLVEHIVHIDGVTGSSPVATTKIPGRKAWDTFLPCVCTQLYDRMIWK